MPLQNHWLPEQHIKFVCQKITAHIFNRMSVMWKTFLCLDAYISGT